MQLPSTLLENAVAEFSKLPGIGKKTALRLVLHLLKQEIGITTQFGETLQKMRNEIQFCQNCYNISDGKICSICSNTGRQKDTICVVENIRDVIAIQEIQKYYLLKISEKILIANQDHQQLFFIFLYHK
jgi:recombination protein RecR